MPGKSSSRWGKARDDDDYHFFVNGHAVCDGELRLDRKEEDPTRFDGGHIPANDGEFCRTCLADYSELLVHQLPEDKRRFVQSHCNGDCNSGHILGDCIHISECFRDSLAEAGYLMKEYGAEVRQVDDYATVCPRARKKERRDRYEVIRV